VIITLVLMTKPVHFNGVTSNEFRPGDRGVTFIERDDMGVGVHSAEGMDYFPFSLVEKVSYRNVVVATSEETPEPRKPERQKKGG
jgi:hypothetical protein